MFRKWTRTPICLPGGGKSHRLKKITFFRHFHNLYPTRPIVVPHQRWIYKKRPRKWTFQDETNKTWKAELPTLKNKKMRAVIAHQAKNRWLFLWLAGLCSRLQISTHMCAKKRAVITRWSCSIQKEQKTLWVVSLAKKKIKKSIRSRMRGTLPERFSGTTGK